MRRLLVPPRCMILAAACWAAPLAAQSANGEAPPAPAAAVDPAAIPMPNLNFTPSEGTIRGYGRYFYFHRDETDFATALADLRECDHYARNISLRIMGQGGPTPYPYAGTMAGAVGGAIGGMFAAAMIDATEGLAARKRIQRINIRRCMTFKGYRTYGLPRNLWRNLNFEEAGDPVPESRRQRFLMIQARAASGPRPTVGEVTE